MKMKKRSKKKKRRRSKKKEARRGSSALRTPFFFSLRIASSLLFSSSLPFFFSCRLFSLPIPSSLLLSFPSSSSYSHVCSPRFFTEGYNNAPIAKLDPRTRTTIRNLRIREDTAKYLRNLDLNSAHYDPKSRSMRENPTPHINPDVVSD